MADRVFASGPAPSVLAAHAGPTAHVARGEAPPAGRSRRPQLLAFSSPADEQRRGANSRRPLARPGSRTPAVVAANVSAGSAPRSRAGRSRVTLASTSKQSNGRSQRHSIAHIVASAVKTVTGSADKKEAKLAAAAAAPPATRTPLPIHVLSGACARAVSILALHPIDTIKTTIQSSQGSLSTIGAVKRIWGANGIPGFYAGLPGTLTGQIPYAAITFTTYEVLKENLVDLVPKSAAVLVHLFSGSVGDICGSVIVVPTEVVKVRLQMGVYGSAKEAISTILGSSQGFMGLYQGYRSQLMRDVPFRAIQLATFEKVKEAYAAAHEGVRPSGVTNLALGALAGAFASTCTCPCDVVKTRLMGQTKDAAAAAAAAAGGPAPYSGIVNTALRVAREEGPTALFKGIVPRVGMIAPSSAIFFMVYEGVKTIHRTYFPNAFAPKEEAEAAAAPAEEPAKEEPKEADQKK
eukprot:tig00001415_g8671.t1